MHIAHVMSPAVPQLTPAPPAPTLGVWPAWMRAFLARRAESRELLALGERELRDIGLTQAEAWTLAKAPSRHR